MPGVLERVRREASVLPQALEQRSGVLAHDQAQPGRALVVVQLRVEPRDQRVGAHAGEGPGLGQPRAQGEQAALHRGRMLARAMGVSVAEQDEQHQGRVGDLVAALAAPETARVLLRDEPGRGAGQRLLGERRGRAAEAAPEAPAAVAQILEPRRTQQRARL